MLVASLPARAADELTPAPQTEQVASSERLLFEEIPTVFTASKKEQLATESPSSVTVITAEDIRRSGANSIPDVLRRVVGMDVVQATSTQWEVSARGVAHSLNSRMLVLVDGRTVYRDLFGGAIWYLLPVVLEDIERIEVVRGPGSALYGANAFFGVINIITKSVQAAAGGLATVSRGSDDLQRNSVVYADPQARVPYKVTAGYDQVDEWGREQVSGRVGKATFLLEPRPVGRAALSLSGGFDQGRARIRLSTTGSATPADWDERARYLMATLEHPDYSVRAFWNHDDTVVNHSDVPEKRIETDVLDVEAQANRRWGEHAVIVGIGARRTVLKAPELLDRASRGEDLFSLFAQDEYRATRKLTLVGGARLDHTTLLGGRFSPRLAALYRLADNQTLRFTAGKAFRRPTFLESYIYLTEPLAPGLDYVYHGNTALKPETLEECELEYRAQPSRRLLMTAEIYRYNMDGGILDGTVATLPPPYPPIPIETTTLNVVDVRARGLELSADYLINPRLTMFANGAWEHSEHPDTGETMFLVPGHKLNAGFRYTAPRGVAADLYVHHVGTNRWLSAQHISDDYTLVNARLAQTLHDGDLELAISAFNLFNDRHLELVKSFEIGRRVILGAHYRF